jgi:riboflavin transporter FmnP
MNLKKHKVFSVREITVAGMLAAAASVLILIEIPMPMMAPFLSLDFSEVPVMLGGLLLGRAAGLLVIAVKNLLHFIFHGSHSMGIGDIANVTASCIYLFITIALNRRWKTKTGSIAALVLGTVCVSFAMLAVNYYFCFPAYVRLMGFTLDSIIKTVHAVNPAVTDVLTLLFYSILPYNLFKYTLTSIIVFLLHERMQKYIDR